MNHFTADYSSSPAATPPRRDLFFNPPEVASTTPLAPPPSAIFGSSRIGTDAIKPLFQRSSPPSSRAAPNSQRKASRTQNATSEKPKSRLFQTSYNTSIGSNRANDDLLGFGEDETFGEEMDTETDMAHPLRKSPMRFSTNSPRRSTARSSQRRTERAPSELPRTGQPDLVPGLARELASRAKPAGPEGEDDLLLDTEITMQQLSDELHISTLDDAPQEVIDSKVHQLLSLWQRHVITAPNEDVDSTIGPPPSASPLDKANYIAPLLLSLHHPQTRGSPVPIPKAILHWLEVRHTSYDSLYRTVASHPTNVTASELFWDAALSLTLRGRLNDVMRILGDADFRYAVTSIDDGAEEPGYRGSQLQTVQTAVYRARQVLNSSPATAGDWDTASESWAIYRDLVETEIDVLTQLVTEPLGTDDLDLLGRQSRTAGSLPLAIYRGLRTMLSILLGSTEVIIANSQDWLEASCALTVWWDGGSEQEIAQWSADVSRATNRRQIEDRTGELYLRRLRDSFLFVTNPDSKDSFPINTLSPVEVGVGCVLQGNVQGAIAILRTLSLCMTSAVAEVGSAAGWLNDGTSAVNGLDSTDLMVLSFGAGREEVNKDEILQEYAISLFGRNHLRNPEGDSIEGWELSLGVLRRLDDIDMMHECVGDLLDQLDVTEQWRAEKVINLCTDLDLPDEARRISERFGDHLVTSTTSYGLALLCYAKSRSSHKIQQLTDMLISYCLVQSRAYPSEDEMDAGLRSLVDTPKTAFTDIADVDPDAAAHLQFYMVGYACVRRFYTLRDADLTPSKKGAASKLQPAARKRAAAKALVAAISSAADSIYGGLYDASRQSAIQVDGLLTLLGEATALLAHPHETGVLNSDQLYALLAAVEDLETVSERVYTATDECLQAAIRNYAGSAPPSPRDMLKKSMSSGTNSNFSFSMMGSEMLARSGESGGGKSVGSAVLVAPSKKDNPTQRGWDWRASFKGNDVEGLGREVLKALRKAIAGELSLRELEG